ncbi:MAG: hypothetical protein ALECFALPRED_003746 [Alectoria fallacina]|uniref:Uncharacterized protein n=1 Tax=Alectoria fallacina TaxID=1903189 RepID=A0A8H3HYG8_9LECA|nr:MAG: hypothetical protein ALECFALPRED_003746 [Alectoria fallacina]
MAQAMPKPLSRRFRVRSPRCDAATRVYIARHLLRRDDEDGAAFLAELSRTVRVERDQSRVTYRRIYPDRRELVVREMLPSLARRHIAGIPAFLAAPNRVVDGEEDGDESDDEDAVEFKEVRERLCGIMGNTDLLDPD